MPAPAPAEPPDQRIVIHGVTWAQYEAMRAALDDKAGLRLTYLEGALEITSPGRRHEHLKVLIARLIEAYADAGGYERRERSQHLPDLDLHRLAEIVAGTPRAEQAQAVWRFRDSLKPSP